MEYIEEFDNGCFAGKGFIESGKKIGVWSYYYETGELKQEIEYQNGVEDGKFKLYHENGLVAWQGDLIKGKHEGLWKEYYENGKIKEEVKYINDEGSYINFWDHDGNQLLKNGTGKKIEEYGSKTLVDIYEQYYDNGQFVKEVKVKGYTVLGFSPREKKE
jgi:antitoxin component YwqK of YwqJK toxin-antitoxin module